MPCVPVGASATHEFPAAHPPPGPCVAPHVRDSLLKLTGGTVAPPPPLAHVPPVAGGTLAEQELVPSIVIGSPKSSQVALIVSSATVHVAPHETADVPHVVPLAVQEHAVHVAGEKMIPSYVSSAVGYEVGHPVVRPSSYSA